MRRTPVHVAALVRPPSVVSDEIVAENGLHLFDGLEPGSPPFDAEAFVEKRAVEVLDDAIGLWALDAGELVLVD